MAQDPPAQDLMRYEAMAQDAMRGVVKTALKRAAAPEGLPGAHHFYITFKTEAPGVSETTGGKGSAWAARRKAASQNPWRNGWEASVGRRLPGPA